MANTNSSTSSTPDTAEQPRPISVGAISFDALGVAAEDATTTGVIAEEPSVSPMLVYQHKKRRARIIRYSLLILVLLLGTGFVLYSRQKAAERAAASAHTNAAQRYGSLIILLTDDSDTASSLNVQGNHTLSINGQLNVNNSLVISPTGQPTNAVAGQLYYDQTTNLLSYYNGQKFVTVLSGNGNSTVVENIGSASGAVKTGDGLSTTGDTLSNSGVLTLQGQTGNVSLVNGGGISIDGTTLSNSGLLSLGGQNGDILLGTGLSISGHTLNAAKSNVNSVSGTGNISVTDDGNGNLTIDTTGQPGMGTITSPGGTVGKLAFFDGVQDIADSLVSQSGSTVTVSGNLTVTGALNLSAPLTVTSGGTGSTTAAGARTNLGAAQNGANSDITSLSGLTTALSVLQGGTGVGTLATNGVLLGNGTSPLNTVVAGGAGQCLISTAGAPTFATCPGSGGVSSLNGGTGVLSVGNATLVGSTITINDATTSTKGIASFNSTNFTVTSGAVNTVQNINSGASPTFNGLTLTTALTVGNGGTGSTTAGGARTNLGAAASGANSDISSLSGLTTALSVVQGGTGTASLTANAILMGNGTGAITAIASGAAGQCLVSTAGAPVFAACPGAGGVVSIDGLTGALSIANTSGSGSTITINDATTAAKGIASFNATNFTVTAGAVNTVQNISTTGTPTFGSITLTTALTVGNGGTGSTTAGGARTNLGAAASGANSDITSLSGLTTALSVIQGGTGTTSLTANGVLIGNGTGAFTSVVGTTGQCLLATTGSSPSFGTCPGSGGVSSVNGLTGALTIANASTAGSTITINDATTSTKGIASFNSTNFTVTSGAVNTIQDINTTATPTFGGLNLGTALSVANGGSGATTSAGARTNLGAAASGANSDITSLSGLTTALSVVQGGTGTASLTANAILMGNGTGAITAIASGSAGQCLVSTAGAPVFTTCPGSGGVVSVDGLTGAISIANTSAAGATITINDATTATKGIASFNGTNFTVTSGAVNTIQDISTTSTPTFGSITLSSALTVANGGTGSGTATGARANLGAAASGANSDITSLSGLTTALSVIQGGTGTTSLTANGVLIGNGTGAFTSVVGTTGQCLIATTGSAPSFGTCPGSGGVTSVNSLTGALTIANASTAGSTITINDATTSTKGIASFNSTNFTVSSGAVNTIQDISTTSSPTFNDLHLSGALSVNTLTPTGAALFGVTSQNLTLQGATTKLTSTSGANTATLTFVAPTATVTYQLQTAAAGTYDICTTAGNCVGTGGGVTTPGGTTNKLAKFSGSQTIADSIISDNGTTATISGNLSVTGTLTLGTQLSVANGGTGATSITANGVVIGNGTGAVGSVTAASAGQCLVSTAGAPTFTTCPGSGGVTSVNGLTGVISIANASGAGATITINDATTSAKGIASFNSTNFTVSSGAVNTIQNINTTAAPTFGQLALTSSQATNPMLVVNNTNVAASGNLLDLQLNGISKLSVAPSGNLTTVGTITSGTINGQTISNSANFTGSVAVATTLSVNTITPSSSLTIGANGQSFTLQGNDSSKLTATSGANITTVGFQTPTASVTYNFAAASAGTYSICTTAGNCVGGGGGVTSPGGTTGKLAKFTGSNSIGDSIISDNGSTVTIAGALSVNTLTPSGALTVGATGQNLTLQGATVSLSATSGGITNTLTFATPTSSNKTITVPDATGTVAVSASGPLSLDASGNLTCATCLTSGGGGGGGVISLNTATGALTLQGASAGSVTLAGTTLTIVDATSSTKGLASFNSTNLTVTSGAVNTIQDIAVTSTPTFAGLNLTTALSIANGGTGATSAAGARTNLGTAKSGANSDITSITGLTTALSVAQGGTGVVSTPTNGQILIGNGTGFSLNTLTAGTGVTISNAAGGITISAPGSGTCASCANTSLNNLASVAINTSLLPGTAGGASLGSSTLPFGQLSLSGTSLSPATNNFLFTGVSTGGTRTLTLPDASGTVAVSGSGYIALNSTTGNITFTGTLAVADGGTGATSASGARTNLGAAASGANSDITSLSGLTTPLSVGQGGTGSTTAGGARTNLGAAASGANSDITSITGLTTALSVSQGGTGLATLTANQILFASSSSTVGQLSNGSSGMCLISNGAGVAPSFQTCTGAGGVSSVDGQTGAVLIANSSGSAGTVTINNAAADGTTKGIATFNSTNFSASSGVINTIQGIATTSSPTFAALTLSTALSVANGGTGAASFTSTNGAVYYDGTKLATTAAGSTGQCLLANTGAAPTFGTCTGAGGVSSLDTLAGALTLANSSGLGSTITINNAKADGSTKGIATFNSTNFSDNGSGVINTIQGISTTATPTFGGLTLSTALSVGNGGTGSTSAGGARTNLGAAASGANSDITSITGLTTALSVSQGGTGLATLTANQLLFANSTSSISQLSNGSSGQCLVSNGAGSAPSFQTCTGAGGVSSIDGQTGAVLLANSSGASGTVTINNAAADGITKGIATFNSTNFSAASGVINTIQGIATTSSPTFAALTLSTALSIANGGTGAASFTSTNGAVYYDGTKLATTAAGTTGQCLLATTGSAPSFGTCTGAGGVSSLDTLVGALTLANSTGLGSTITINNAKADGSTKGIATFTSGNFADNGSGLISIKTGGVTTTEILDGTIANADLAGGTYAAITGTGALAAGSIASGFGTISTGNNITTTATVQGGTGVFTGGGSLMLGTASSTTGSIKLFSSAGTGSVTLSLNNPGTNNFNLNIPTLTNNDTICTVILNNCTGAGATTIGALDGGTANANAATISAGTLYLQSASTSFAGVVNTTTQSFTGAKTFSSAATFSSTINTNTFNGNTLTFGSASAATVQSATNQSLNITAVGSGALNLTGNNITVAGSSLTVNTSATFSNQTEFDAITLFASPPTASATTSVIQIGSAIAGGNAVANGGTYLGLNAPGSGAGSAADLLNFQVGGSSKIKIDNSGNITNSGFTNSATGFKFNGTAGSTTTCSGGQFLQNQVVQGGITTGGTCATAGGGVTTVGALDGGTANANGATISGSTIYLQSASVTNPGLINTTTQSFAGAKTFTGTTTVSTNSATAFQVKNTGGTSFLTVDTSGANVTIDDSGAAGTVQIGNTTGAVAQTINIGTNSTTSATNIITIGSHDAISNTFNKTGSTQSYTVPAGVTSINVTLYGGAGGTFGGGGGQTQGTIAVTPGETLTIVVAGQGSNNSGLTGGAGGYGGGANGGNGIGGGNSGGGGGGGATQILRGSTVLALAAGGGGGSFYGGADGGGTTGATAAGSIGGKGGSQSVGGAGGTGSPNGTTGGSLAGGNGATAGGIGYGGGGGGGGYYGGGGGAVSGGGGGGGAAFVPAGGSTTTGGHSGDGQAIITIPGGGSSTISLNGGAVQETISSSGHSIQTSTNSATAFQVQNATGTSILNIDTTGSGAVTIANTLSVGATINAVGGFKFNGTSGSTITCSGGQFLQNQVVQGGITTGGTCATAGGGVTTVGTLDGGTANANGVTISGSTIYLQSASASFAGVVNTGTQTFAGAKTFSGAATFSNGVTVSAGGAAITGTTSINTSGSAGTTIGNISSTTTVNGRFVVAANPTIAAGAFNLGGFVTSTCNTILSICDLNLTSSGGQSIFLENGSTSSTIALNGQTVVTGAGATAFTVSHTGSGSVISAVQGTASSTSPTVLVKQGATPGAGADAFQVQNSSSVVLGGFNSGGRVYYKDSGFTNTINTATLTANRTITLPDATGTVCLDSGNCLGGAGGGANTSLSNLVATSINQSLVANANNTLNLGSSSTTWANGFFGTSIQGPRLDSISGALVIGDTNATNITIGSTTNANTLTLGQSTASNTISIGTAATGTGNTQTISIGTGSTSTGKDIVTIGSMNAASGTTIQGGTGGITLASNGGASSTTGTIVKSVTNNSTLAFQVQNASSVSLLTVDTSTSTITLGTGGNTFTLSAGTFEPILAGNARHSKKILLNAEYGGAVLDAQSDTGGAVNCSTNSTGTMTSGFDATSRQNYYNWTAPSTTQCYDVVVQVPIPSDWAAWNGAPAMFTYNSVGTDTTSVTVDVIDSTGTNDSSYSATAYNGVTSGTSFSSNNLTAFGGSYSAGGYLTMKIRMSSASAANVRIGNITLNYFSKY